MAFPLSVLLTANVQNAKDVAALAENLAQVADKAALLEGRLKLATQSNEEFTQAQQELARIAQATRSGISETTELFIKLAPAVREAGGSQKDALLATENFSKALKLGGASAGEASSATLQFGQALASGVLRGDEFNSIAEASPAIMDALAKGLGVARGELRAMAEAGQLTAQRVIPALNSQTEALNKAFAALPVTVSDATTLLGNAFTAAIADFNKTEGATGALAEALAQLEPAIKPAVDIIGGSLKLALNTGIGAFNAFQIGVKGVSLGVTEALALIVEGVEKTARFFGANGIADEAEGVLLSLKARSEELRLGIEQDAKEINEAGLRMSDGLGRTAAGVVGLYDAAQGSVEAAADATVAATDAMAGAAAGAEQTLAADALARERSLIKAGESAKQLGLSYENLTGIASVEAQKTVAAFEQLAREGGLEADALGRAFEAAFKKLESPEDIEALKSALQRLYADGGIAAGQYEQQLERLQARQAQLTVEIDNGTLAAREAARDLGLDYDALAGKVDAAAQASIAAFGRLASNAKGNTDLIGAGIGAVLDKLNSRAEIEAFEVALRDMAAKGTLSTRQLDESLERTRDRLATLAPAAGTAAAETEAAFQRLGLTAQTELNRIAAQAEQDFARVRAAGGSLSDQQTAFVAYAKAALDAAKARGEYALQEAALALKGKAATEQQRLAVDAHVASYKKAKTEALDPLEAAYEKLGITSSRVLRQQADELEKANRLVQQSTAQQSIKDQAFAKAAQAAIAAAAAEGEYALRQAIAAQRAAAQTGAQADAVGALERQYFGLSNAAADAGAAAADGHRRAGDAAEEQTRSVDLLSDAYERQRRAAMSASAAAESARRAAQDARTETFSVRGFDSLSPAQQAQVNNLLRGAADRSGTPPPPGSPNNPALNIRVAQELADQFIAANRQREQRDSEPPATRSSGGLGKRVEVTLNLNGERIVGDFDDDGARRLINALESARSRA